MNHFRAEAPVAAGASLTSMIAGKGVGERVKTSATVDVGPSDTTFCTLLVWFLRKGGKNARSMSYLALSLENDQKSFGRCSFCSIHASEGSWLADKVV